MKNSILAALGEDLENLKQEEMKGFWAEVILHSSKPGIFAITVHDVTIPFLCADIIPWFTPSEYPKSSAFTISFTIVIPPQTSFVNIFYFDIEYIISYFVIIYFLI